MKSNPFLQRSDETANSARVLSLHSFPYQELAGTPHISQGYDHDIGT